MIFIYFKAPFGTFRAFQSVEMAATMDFFTHSAAYGLLLGLAGVGRDRKEEFLGARIALGTWGNKLPMRGRSYQQLHWLRTSDTKKLYDEAMDRSKGTKPHIRPVWREFLHKLEGYICLEHPELEHLIQHGINDPSTVDYWGLPFMGDNNFFVERLDLVSQPKPCQWLCQLDDRKHPQGERLFYLSLWTDYETGIKSRSGLFYLSKILDSPPDESKVRLE